MTISYWDGSFDLFFNWLIFTILGCFILLSALSLCYHNNRKKTSTTKQHKKQEEKVYSQPIKKKEVICGQ